MKPKRRCDFVYLGTNAGHGITYTPPLAEYIYSLAVLYDYSFLTQTLVTSVSRNDRQAYDTFSGSFLLEFLY